MRKHTAIVLPTLLGVCLMLTAPLDGQKNKPGSGGGSNTLQPVSADFRCPTGAGCLGLDRIQGDTLGTYRGTTPSGSSTTQEGQAENMGGYFTERYLFLFSLKVGMGRYVSLAFDQPVDTPPCTSTQTCRKNFVTAMTDVSLPGSRTYPVDALGADLPNGFMSIPVGQSAKARWYFNFADPSGRDLLWTVRFDPALYPGSTLLTVARTDASRWVISANDGDVAQLVSATTGGKAVKINEGY